MICPKCSGTLATDDGATIPQSRCDGCGALWIQRTALETTILLDARQRGLDFSTVALLEGPARATTLKCPRCTNSVLSVITLREVPVEACIECGGLLLDAGESAAITNRALAAKRTFSEAYREMLRLVAARKTDERNRARMSI